MSRFTNSEESVGYKYGTLSRRMSAAFAVRLKPFDIKTEQWSVLYQVYANEGINQRELSVRSGKDQPSVTRILDVLDKKQLIIRTPDAKDRRAFLIYATPAAKTLMNDTIPLEQQLNNELLDGITEEQIQEMSLIMKKFSDNIDKMMNEPRLDV
ncbi:MarR family winged helix-turn-helix transcriptional regulator [Paenibacillus pini]|uniref:Transcriptional regulator n=1 Tax=Paenibacillus pini JCM 16418 TaxID=1236976 RepID=W7YUD6_9BACL|nr:MarR family transcriptional regulator [Paenibacillus pini]GAF08186.1 transcriptional regulator [Paenibacillus pini JCM 16418]